MFDDTHQSRVDTSLEKNPTSGRFKSIDLRFVFRRNHTGDKDRDGNPLIYALKGMNRYKIVPMYRKMFLTRAKLIVEAMKDDLSPDFVMSVPSNNNFGEEFGRCVAAWLKVPFIQPTFLSKKTIQEILEEEKLARRKITNKRTLRKYNQQMASWKEMDEGQHVSMKDLDNKIRPFFNPMTVTGTFPNIHGKNVLITDDLLSSGTSILSTAELIRGGGASVDTGVCFLSGL
jgi:hypothetical protein